MKKGCFLPIFAQNLVISWGNLNKMQFYWKIDKNRDFWQKIEILKKKRRYFFLKYWKMTQFLTFPINWTTGKSACFLENLTFFNFPDFFMFFWPFFINFSKKGRFYWVSLMKLPPILAKTGKKKCYFCDFIAKNCNFYAIIC